jgi:hypothetical protein
MSYYGDNDEVDDLRERVRALREALERIASDAGDSITGHLPAAVCRRVATAALAATSDPIEAPSDVHPTECGT